jgi:hypothetical protein
MHKPIAVHHAVILVKAMIIVLQAVAAIWTYWRDGLREGGNLPIKP